MFLFYLTYKHLCLSAFLTAHCFLWYLLPFLAMCDPVSLKFGYHVGTYRVEEFSGPELFNMNLTGEVSLFPF